jgi:hypothetical protein
VTPGSNTAKTGIDRINKIYRIRSKYSRKSTERILSSSILSIL